MAITAIFAADFSSFNTEVKKTETQLELFEKTVDKTGTSIDTMATKGGTSGAKVSSLSGVFKQFDSTLAAMGVNIRPVIGALDEMTTAATSASGGLGKLQLAGATLSAAIGGWAIGRKIAESFKTDETIGNWVAKWMGWGDVAKETAGAVEDSLKRASEAAQRPITTMAEAAAVMTEWKKKHQKAAEDDAEAMKVWAAAAEEVAIASQDHARVLETINGKTVEAAKFALEHGASQKSVAEAYKLTKPEIAAILDLMEQEKTKLKELEEWNRKVADAMKEHWDGVGAVVDQVFGMDALKKATTWMDAIDAMGGSVEHLRSAELEELNKTMLDGIDALARSGNLTSQQSSAFAELAIKAQAALEAMRPVVKVTDDLAKAQWDYVTALDAELAATIKTRDEAKKKADEDAQRAAAKKNAEGGLLPNAIVGRNGVAIDMFGRPTAGFGAINNLPIMNINIMQPLGTPEAIAAAVGGAVSGSYRRGGNRLPV